jgi:predicted adenine nucleotide alpha hydrolase (AANH) superfamily ATPase
MNDIEPDDRQCFCGCVFSAHAKADNNLYVCAHHVEHQLATGPPRNAQR